MSYDDIVRKICLWDGSLISFLFYILLWQFSGPWSGVLSTKLLKQAADGTLSVILIYNKKKYTCKTAVNISQQY